MLKLRIALPKVLCDKVQYFTPNIFLITVLVLCNSLAGYTEALSYHLQIVQKIKQDKAIWYHFYIFFVFNFQRKTND